MVVWGKVFLMVRVLGWLGWCVVSVVCIVCMDSVVGLHTVVNVLCLGSVVRLAGVCEWCGVRSYDLPKGWQFLAMFVNF